MSNKILITISEIAATLRQSERTVRRLIADSGLPAIRMGHYYTTTRKLAEWIEAKIEEEEQRTFGPR